jgi:hypothetical protein
MERNVWYVASAARLAPRDAFASGKGAMSNEEKTLV